MTSWVDEEVRVVRTEAEANAMLVKWPERWFLLDVKFTGEGILEKASYIMVRRTMR